MHRHKLGIDLRGVVNCTGCGTVWYLGDLELVFAERNSLARRLEAADAEIARLTEQLEITADHASHLEDENTGQAAKLDRQAQTIARLREALRESGACVICHGSGKPQSVCAESCWSCHGDGLKEPERALLAADAGGEG